MAERRALNASVDKKAWSSLHLDSRGEMPGALCLSTENQLLLLLVLCNWKTDLHSISSVINKDDRIQRLSSRTHPQLVKEVVVAMGTLLRNAKVWSKRGMQLERRDCDFCCRRPRCA